MPELRDIFASKYLQGLAGLKPIPQTVPYAGGCCALATALKYLGEHAYEQMMVETLQPSAPIGISFDSALRYLAGRGFKATAWRSYSIEAIIGRVRTGRVTILDWPDRGDHWLLMAGVEPVERVFVLADPSRPKPFFGMPFEAFTQEWNASKRLALIIDRFDGNDSAAVAKKKHVFWIQDYEENQRKHRP